jgi:hypothetical protein
MRQLKPHQQDLLDEIVKRGGLPVGEVDGRILRALRTSGLAEMIGDRVEATAAGRDQVSPIPERISVQSKLNDRQEEVLRLILRQGSVPQEDLDGRVARALTGRGLATRRGDLLVPSVAGRAYFDQKPLPQPRRGRRRKENGRATVIRRAISQLESAIPPDAEVLVGNIMAAADDLVDAFRRHASRLERSQKA